MKKEKYYTKQGNNTHDKLININISNCRIVNPNKFQKKSAYRIIEQINQKLQQILADVIEAKARELDPEPPAVLAAHVWVANASVRQGSEKSMTIGQEHTLMLSNIAHPAFDYIALGHIHRHQVLNEKPPVVYAGSLERLDFGEADDEKGFYLVEIGEKGEDGRRPVSFEFHPLAGRRFITVSVDIEPSDIEPTAAVLKAIAEQWDEFKDAVVMLSMNLPAEAEGQVRDSDIRNALGEAHYFTIAKKIKRESRVRLGGLAAEEISPLEALKTYLESKKGISPERARLLLEYGERLIEEQKAGS